MGTPASGKARRVERAAPRGGRGSKARVTQPEVAPPEVQLTARGAVTGLFLVCFFAMVLANWTGWSAIADFAFVGGGVTAARYTKRGALLALAVSPPLIFLAACACAELLTAPDLFTTGTGIFVTLGASAPWLFTGTALILGVALRRGLTGEIANLRRVRRPLTR